MSHTCENPSPSSTVQQHPNAQPAPGQSVEQQLLSDETAQIVRRKAHRLIARAGLPKADFGEIVQALHVILVQASKPFDPERGTWLAFAERSLQYAVNKFKRHRYTDSRHPHRCVSLNILVKVHGEDEPHELAQLVTAVEQDARTGGRTIDAFELADLGMDLTEFMAKLPPKLRVLAEALQRETILEISRRTGTHRSTLYDNLELLRRAAEDQGLSKYLE